MATATYLDVSLRSCFIVLVTEEVEKDWLGRLQLPSSQLEATVAIK